jgi:hypothetical protein
MSKRAAIEASPGNKLPSGNPANIRLDAAIPMWLQAPGAEPEDRFLLLEDPETGDVLMPLMYMKNILGSNYSRKLSALKHRLVTIPNGSSLADPKHKDLLYWHWAFEAPHGIKLLVRDHIGENTPQGHLRLVLLPIVYNALVDRAELHQSPIFLALHRAMRHSTYWPYLCVSPELVPQLDEAAQVASAAPQPQEGNGDAAADPAPGGDPAETLPQKVFSGPRVLESTAVKYMFMFRDQKEIEASKKARTTTAVIATNGLLTATVLGAGSSRQRSGGMTEGSEGEDQQVEQAIDPLFAQQGEEQLDIIGNTPWQGGPPALQAGGGAANAPSHDGIDPVIADYIRQTVSRAVDIKFAPMLQEQQLLKQMVFSCILSHQNLVSHLPARFAARPPAVVPPATYPIQQAGNVVNERMMAEQLGLPYENPPSHAQHLPRVQAPASQRPPQEFPWPSIPTTAAAFPEPGLPEARAPPNNNTLDSLSLRTLLDQPSLFPLDSSGLAKMLADVS